MRVKGTAPYSIGPPKGRRGQTGALLAACTAAAAILLLVGWQALGRSRWAEFLSTVCVTFAGLLLTVSIAEIALEYQRRLRIRPLRDELLRRLLTLVVKILGDIAVVIGQPVLMTDRPSAELTEAARSLLLHLQILFVERIPRAGKSVPQTELDHYIQWGNEAAELVQRVDPVISSQILPLLAAMDEDAELLRRSLRLATEIGSPGPRPRRSASEALTFLIRLAQAAGNVLDQLRTLYEQDPAWRSVFDEGEVVWMHEGPGNNGRSDWPGVMGPPDPI